MTSRSTFVPDARVDRLLRSLVGVADVRLRHDPDGTLTEVVLLRDGRVQEHQLVRNVISALRAGFRLRLDAEQVAVVVDAAEWERVSGDVAPSVPGDAHGSRGAHGSNGNGARTNGSRPHPADPVQAGRGIELAPLKATPGAAPPVEHANGRAPGAGSGRRARLEAVEVERCAGTLRCRVAVRVGAAVFATVAEVRDGPSAEAELAARVALDALRAGGLTSDQLEGVALASIAGNIFVVAAVRSASGMTPRACAAPLVHTMANAAAEAVLRAHGPVVPDERALSAGSGT